jgi:hypothetical protein
MNARFGIHMGPRQVELVERVRREGMIEVTGNRTNEASAMKLADRGILVRRHFRGRCVYGPGPRLKMIS